MGNSAFFGRFFVVRSCKRRGGEREMCYVAVLWPLLLMCICSFPPVIVVAQVHPLFNTLQSLWYDAYARLQWWYFWLCVNSSGNFTTGDNDSSLFENCSLFGWNSEVVVVRIQRDILSPLSCSLFWISSHYFCLQYTVWVFHLVHSISNIYSYSLYCVPTVVLH